MSQETSSEPPDGFPAETARWRKTLWCLLVAVVILPPFWTVSAIAGLVLIDVLRGPSSEFWNEAILFALAPAVAFTATIIIARWGLRRSTHRSNGTLWGWSLLATGMLTLVLVASVATLRVHQSSQDKCVLCNVRQLSAAADQYFLEYGESTVALANLIGATNYIKALNTVDHETYPAYYTQGMTITVTGVGGLRTITYAP